ncbi:MAG: IPT/TIG domain-containing protein, partial [Opitutales bacterium]
YPMVRGQIGDNIWSYDYKLPTGFDEANYYYVAVYEVIREDLLKPRRKKSQLYRFQLENRYVGNLLAYRAPIGSKISVQGRGFTKYDKVQFGPESAVTQFLSENELQFTVPSLPSGIDYALVLEGGAGKLPIGDFRIDESEIRVTPKAVEVSTGDVETLLFNIDFDAPDGGLVAKIETNVPASVIMGEVRIAAGARSVSAPVKGGTPGSGSIFVTIAGLRELVIPVTVTAVPAPAPEPRLLPPTPAP